MDPLFYHHNTQRPPLKSCAVEPIVCFLLQLLLLFVPSLYSKDQVDPPANTDRKVLFQTRHLWATRGVLDHNVGPICVDLVLVPVCDVCVPFTALAVGSVDAARSPHLPVDPASDTVVTLALWRTGAVVLGVGVTGSSLPVCPPVTSIMSLLSNSGFTGYSLFLIKRHKLHATGPTQVVLVPRLITCLCYYLLDQNGVGARTRNKTGCVESSFEQSPSLISRSLFCTQGTRTLTQVMLVYLIVFGTFCFPGITSSTVSPGLVSKYPG